jgi:hypothetical protein
MTHSCAKHHATKTYKNMKGKLHPFSISVLDEVTDKFIALSALSDKERRHIIYQIGRRWGRWIFLKIIMKTGRKPGN